MWMMTMQLISSKKIKDHYGAFVDTARKQGVVHTSHGRKTLVTLSFEAFEELAYAVSDKKPEYKIALETLKRKENSQSIVDFAGAGTQHSTFQSTHEVDAFIRKLRKEWN